MCNCYSCEPTIRFRILNQCVVEDFFFDSDSARVTPLCYRSDSAHKKDVKFVCSMRVISAESLKKSYNKLTGLDLV